MTLDEVPLVSSATNDFATIGSTISASLIAKLDPLPHTDILAARVGESSGIQITVNNDSANFRVTYTGGLGGAGCSNGDDALSGICPGDTLLISDCTKSLAFLVTETSPLSTPTVPTEVKIIHNSGANPGAEFNGQQNAEGSFTAAGPDYQFEEGSEIVRMTTKFFYVGKGVNGPALFVKNGFDAGVELVEGVENLQVLYGQDTDGDNVPNHFVPADILTDFAQVTAVRISILLRSVKNLPWRTAAEKTHLLGGTNAMTATTITSPEDKRLRKTMNMTIKLRNRAFSL